jgi:hypothetical protein
MSTQTSFRTNEKGVTIRRVVVYQRDCVKELQYQMIDGKWWLYNWQTHPALFKTQ